MNAVCSAIAAQSVEFEARRLDLKGFYDQYHRDTFRAPPRLHDLDGWRIEYMAISIPQTAHRTPVVIIGGAFQNFNSYKYCVEQLLAAGPIILVDLPSMGNNQQLHNTRTGASAGTLELPDLAHLLGRWIQTIGLPRVSIMGMSLGSVVACHFVQQFPALIDRLVLMGVMQKTRHSWRMLLEESLHLLRENRMDEFGQAVVLYLLNHAKLDRTRMSPTARRLFYQQMAQFAHTERVRYEINCLRLLRLQDVPVPQCPTLVAAGEFDSFTLPHENAHCALQCPDMQFAFIENADHLPQLQRRKETMGLFATFLRNGDIGGCKGVRPVSRAELGQLERRGEPRFVLPAPHTRLTHRHDEAVSLPVDIVNVSFFGVLLDAGSEAGAAALMAEPRNLVLHLGELDGEVLRLECLMFEQTGRQVRALLKHGSFEKAEQMKRFLDGVGEGLNSNY